MPRPRIGISMDTGSPDENRKVYEINSDYPEAVFRNGGLPVLLPHTRNAGIQAEMLASIDALLIPGGDDCDSRLYNAAPNPKNHPMDPMRQEFDLALLRAAQEKDIPTLGICLGHQLINVLRGGSLHQNIAEVFPESPVSHAKIIDPSCANSSFHDITLRPDTAIFSIYRAQHVHANSRHRQAIDRIGSGLIPAAYSEDGILEAIEDPALTFFIGVQWHPENLPGTAHDRLFAAFVQAARTAHDRNLSLAP